MKEFVDWLCEKDLDFKITTYRGKIDEVCVTTQIRSGYGHKVSIFKWDYSNGVTMCYGVKGEDVKQKLYELGAIN